ncbi:MAG: hypothetical protein ACFE75_04150 [Candidatus Hodarchaeota archaeon]
MTVILNLDQVLDNLIKEFETGVYFIIITSENGAVIKSFINPEFNKTSIGLNMSQLYELAEEITSEIGVHAPDFNLIHCSNYYLLSIKILGNIIIVLLDDQVNYTSLFGIINKCIVTN